MQGGLCSGGRECSTVRVWRASARARADCMCVCACACARRARVCACGWMDELCASPLVRLLYVCTRACEGPYEGLAAHDLKRRGDRRLGLEDADTTGMGNGAVYTRSDQARRRKYKILNPQNNPRRLYTALHDTHARRALEKNTDLRRAGLQPLSVCTRESFATQRHKESRRDNHGRLLPGQAPVPARRRPLADAQTPALFRSRPGPHRAEW